METLSEFILYNKVDVEKDYTRDELSKLCSLYIDLYDRWGNASYREIIKHMSREVFDYERDMLFDLEQILARYDPEFVAKYKTRKQNSFDAEVQLIVDELNTRYAKREKQNHTMVTPKTNKKNLNNELSNRKRLEGLKSHLFIGDTYLNKDLDRSACI